MKAGQIGFALAIPDSGKIRSRVGYFAVKDLID
jgi:hypothetical protein